MSVKKKVHDANDSEVIVARAKDFWERNNRVIVIASVVVILLAGGYFGYQRFVKAP